MKVRVSVGDSEQYDSEKALQSVEVGQYGRGKLVFEDGSTVSVDGQTALELVKALLDNA